MLGNIIGKNKSAHFESNFLMHNPEYRLKALRSSDRSVTSQYARETDKGFPINLMEGDTVRTYTIK